MITDQNFDINHTNEYTLSIQISLNGFSFVIVDQKKNQLLALKQLPVTISSENFLGRRFKEWVKEEELLQKKFSEINIVYHTRKFTLIPGEFYNYEKQNEIARLIFGKQDGYSCHDNYLPNDSCNLVFSVANSFLDVSTQIFRGHNLKHPLTVINRMIRKKLKNNENIMALYFEKNSFCLITYYKQNMQLANSFNLFHINDAVFFISSILKEQKISPGKIAIHAAGNIEQKEELYQSLQKYFGKVELLIPDINYNPEVFKGSLHHFFALC